MCDREILSDEEVRKFRGHVEGKGAGPIMVLRKKGVLVKAQADLSGRKERTWSGS